MKSFSSVSRRLEEEDQIIIIIIITTNNIWLVISLWSCLYWRNEDWTIAKWEIHLVDRMKAYSSGRSSREIEQFEHRTSSTRLHPYLRLLLTQLLFLPCLEWLLLLPSSSMMFHCLFSAHSSLEPSLWSCSFSVWVRIVALWSTDSWFHVSKH